MPYLAKRADPSPPPGGLQAPFNLYGDLICPHCRCRIITPPDFRLVPGWGRCPICRQAFRVTRQTAAFANELADLYRKS